MSSRIRYDKTRDPNVLESTRKFQHASDGSRYKVRLKLDDLTYYLIEDSSDTVVATEGAISLHKLKIKAKKAMKIAGIEFSDEKRKERHGSDTREANSQA